MPKPKLVSYPDVVKKQSSTELLCTLTRLKLQQKYLECNQAHLNVNNFEDYDEEDGGLDGKSCPSSTLVAAINEIEQLKQQMSVDLKSFRNNALHDVKEVLNAIRTFREDIYHPAHLRQCTMNNIQERIIDVNTKLERLRDKVNAKLKNLVEDQQKMESEVTYITPKF